MNFLYISPFIAPHKFELVFMMLVVVLILLYFFPKVNCKSKKRHIRNINKSKEILFKMNQFEGVNREARIIAYLRKIDPYVFEELLLEALIKKGFKITRNKRYSGDGGIDGKAYFREQLYFIQAKRYKRYVSAQHLENFQTVVGDKKGLFIHTGKTGKDTYEKYKRTNIEIVSGQRLIELVLTKESPDK